MKKLALTITLCLALTGCAMFRSGPTDEQLAHVEDHIAMLISWRDEAIEAGLKAEIVEAIEADLKVAQEWMATLREAQPSSWFDLLLLGVGGAAGAGLLGAKAAKAAKYVSTFRKVVKGIDEIKKDLTAKDLTKLENTFRELMDQADKDRVKEART